MTLSWQTAFVLNEKAFKKIQLFHLVLDNIHYRSDSLQSYPPPLVASIRHTICWQVRTFGMAVSTACGLQCILFC